MLVTKNTISSSSMYTGYLILKEMKIKKTDKISIYELSNSLKKNNIKNSRQLILGLAFLYSVDILDFEEANIWIKK
ncbi:ABC-three component system middle component 6 [Tissierellaceae bacterium HCP3S3_D8]